MIPYVFVGAHVVVGFLVILPVMIWASLVGWLVDAIWRKATRRGREEAHQAWRIKREIHKKAEEYRKERLERGLPAKLPAKIAHAEWEEVAAKRLVYGPWGDDGQSCFLPQRGEPNSTPQA